ncbi:hypothetical protein [Sporolactobacillus inulinus]|uniref:hypothetical protein n=1 Tax=Sporolactobacillus inulinus TaxID=2078 RepID=UPI0021CC987B|nr:hypothetical protein [Sporolactobacillus inulinus]
MTKSIFDEHVERNNTNSVKWDGAAMLYGKSHVLPMWIADMDFRAPDCILDAMSDVLDQKSSVTRCVQNHSSNPYGTG